MPQVQFGRSEEDELVHMARSELVFSRMTARGRHWPVTIGVVEVAIGVIITLLGTLEVFVLPMVESEDGNNLIIFDKRNCYGCGLYAGLVMVLTGSTAIRASLSQRNTTVYRFFNLTIVSLLVYTGLTILLIMAYSMGWTSPDAYAKHSAMKEVHVFVTISTVLGLLFALTGFIQYFDVICCGQHALWAHWAACCGLSACYSTQGFSRFESGLSEDSDSHNNPV